VSVLLTSLWPALSVALLLGLVAGGLSGLPRDRIGLAVAICLVIALAILSGLALSERVPGLAGLWVETATLMLATYLAGCALGGIGRAARSRLG